MPRYFFDVQDSVLHEDDNGTECADLRVAQSAAIQLSGEMLRDTPDGFRASAGWIVRVRDESGRVVFSLRLQAEGAASAETGLH